MAALTTCSIFVASPCVTWERLLFISKSGALGLCPRLIAYLLLSFFPVDPNQTFSLIVPISLDVSLTVVTSAQTFPYDFP